MYQPKHLRKWREPVNYVSLNGRVYDDYWIGAMRFFRCSPVDKANYAYIKDLLLDCGAQPGEVFEEKFSDEVLLKRFYLFIAPDCERALKMADMLAERVLRKGSIDPPMEVKHDGECVRQGWGNMSNRQKILMCLEAGLPWSVAKNRTFPEHLPDSDSLYRLLSEIC